MVIEMRRVQVRLLGMRQKIFSNYSLQSTWAYILFTLSFVICPRNRPRKSHHPDIRGVSVGAILSNYQRVRVEHV
jgi:hypothetical protein